MFSSKYTKFWKWFQTHEDEIFHFESNQDEVFDKLTRRLQRIHSDLVFEFSSVSNGKREFTVSAGGIRAVFPEVTKLVREAPAFSRWQVIAFRQRQDIPNIRCGDKELDRDALYFDYVPADGKIDLTVFIPGMSTASKEEIVGLKTIGYLTLDSLIGEFDVETKIAGIELVDTSRYPERRRIALRELTKIVDQLPETIQ